MTEGLKDNIVTFESHIPDEVLESLNSSYEQIFSSSDDKEAVTRSSSQGATDSTQRQLLGPLSTAWLLWFVLILPLAAFLWATRHTWVRERPQLSGTPSFDHLTPFQQPIPTGKSLVNLAAKGRGAYILPGYTTPPALSSWWSWSSRFRADPNCMILPMSQECWPVKSDSAIGLGFETMSSLSSVNVILSAPAENNAIEADSSAWTPVEEISLYGMDPNGHIVRIGTSRSTQLEVNPNVPPYAQIIIRIRLRGSISSRAGCVRTIEVWGSSD